MYFLYSILLSLGFLVMSPLFLLRREKYASGFKQRLGNYPAFKHDGRPVIWLHCVSVGETNAARPLVEQLRAEFPDHRLVISTTTKTGQELAQKIFAQDADAVFYFPFDFKFAVRRALANYKPSLVLLMETEIWPRFIREAKRSGAKVAIVNGRLSQKSFERYSRVRSFVEKVLANVDLALMQGEIASARLILLGIEQSRVKTTGNLKYDISQTDADEWLVRDIRKRFDIAYDNLVVVAASTHRGEEEFVLKAFSQTLVKFPYIRMRLLIAPRHPERFDEVEALCRSFETSANRDLASVTSVRRSHPEKEIDKVADVILLDTIGELRTVYGLADIVVVGGSMVPHGGQNLLEPANVGKAIIIGPFTHNFDDAVTMFRDWNALIQ